MIAFHPPVICVFFVFYGTSLFYSLAQNMAGNWLLHRTEITEYMHAACQESCEISNTFSLFSSENLGLKQQDLYKTLFGTIVEHPHQIMVDSLVNIIY